MRIIRGEPLHSYYSDDENLNFIERFIARNKGVMEGFYQRMFNEDFSRVFRTSRVKKGPLFNIDSNDEVLAKRLLENISSQYSSRSTDENICTWVEQIAQSLLFSKTAYYFFHDIHEKEEFRIVRLSPDDIFKLFNTHIQLVPKRFESHWKSDGELLPRELRILEASKLIRFNICNSIKKLLSDQNRTLSLLDHYRHNKLEFYSQATYENPRPKNYFDYSYWSETQDKALYLATHETGWNARNLGPSERSVYFDYYRMIRFRRNQLIFRDNILFQLGEELTRVGRQYNEVFSIVISPTNALPKVEELNELEELFSQEKVSFTKIMDYYFER